MTLKLGISQALDSLLEEIHTTADAKILHSAALKLTLPSSRVPYNTPQKPVTKYQVQSRPLCKQVGRNNRHFLSKCTYLPAEDCAFLAKARLISNLDEDDNTDNSDFFGPPEAEDLASPPHPAARIVSHNAKQSPHFNAFYRHHSLKLTFDTDTETSMIKASVAHGIDAPIDKTSQQALQADRVMPLIVVSETHLTS